MTKLNRKGLLALEDIAAADFDASLYGRTFEQLMGTIHGVLPDGRLVTGMEVFRRAYAAVGLGWLLAPTGWPVLKSFFDFAYKLFAQNRLRLTGRPQDCASGRCAIPARVEGNVQVSRPPE